jgi:hypothetical protein
MKELIADMQHRQLLLQQPAENLSVSYSGPALYLVTRSINKGCAQPNAKEPYPDELCTFALTLQFYSARAYECETNVW